MHCVLQRWTEPFIWEYSEFIGQIRENQGKGMEIRTAMDQAVESCLSEGILTDILIRSKAEVLDMILEEYDEKKTREYLRKEAMDMGMEQANELTRLLLDAGRIEDLKRAVQDKAYQKELLKEYGLQS